MTQGKKLRREIKCGLISTKTLTELNRLAKMWYDEEVKWETRHLL